MNGFKKILHTGIVILAVIVLNYACNNSPMSSGPNTTATGTPTISDLKVGGVYSTKQKDGTFSISKILAIDDFSVHVRMYSNKFIEVPKEVSTDSLMIFIGHSPLDKQGFLLDSPILLKVEPVQKAELDGYKQYLKDMNMDTSK